MSKIIPILLLSRNNYYELRSTVDSLIKNTLYSYELVIADNNSNDPAMIEYLEEVEFKGIKVIRNKSNLWILGLNNAIKWIENNIEHELIVVSDSDLLMPDIVDGECWLMRMVSLMRKYPVLGKLGLSLSLENIKHRKDLEHIYKGELSYYKTKLFNDVYLAPVDTTTAIYRKDIFIDDKFRFFPGHGSYIKPYYHVGRVANFPAAYHIGWDNYGNNLTSPMDINQKIKCFTIVGGFIDKTVLNQGGSLFRIYHRLMKYFFKSLWAIRLFWCWFIYIICNGVVNQNKIYKSSKKGY